MIENIIRSKGYKLGRPHLAPEYQKMDELQVAQELKAMPKMHAKNPFYENSSIWTFYPVQINIILLSEQM